MVLWWRFEPNPDELRNWLNDSNCWKSFPPKVFNFFYLPVYLSRFLRLFLSFFLFSRYFFLFHFTFCLHILIMKNVFLYIFLGCVLWPVKCFYRSNVSTENRQHFYTNCVMCDHEKCFHCQISISSAVCSICSLFKLLPCILLRVQNVLPVKLMLLSACTIN